MIFLFVVCETVSDMCLAFNFNEKLRATYVGYEIVLLRSRVVALHIFANGRDVTLALYVHA